MSLIANERTKLLANALDRASTACVTVGILAPIAAVIYGLPGNSPPVWLFILATIFWLFAAVVLHMAARNVLGGLIE